ncbi:ABC transporter permease [Gemella cuniculi]|uniref:ABC transporter permease n=1 Tax=Gemella cuniculi TaxID=150240 RepID=UPI000482D0FA|nr:ABC transporter permease [Gemella cuniculi]
MRAFMIAKKVFKELFRDKRTLAMMFLAPIFIMWLMNIMFSASTTTNINVATVNVPMNVVAAMKEVDDVNIVEYSSLEDAEKNLKDNQVDTLIIFKEDKYEVNYSNIDSTKTLKARQVLKSSIISSNIKSLAESIKNPQILEKIQSSNVEVKESYQYGNEDTTFFTKLVPILIGFIAFFFVFLISGMALLKERTSGTLERLLATPVKRSEIVFGYTLSYGVIAIIQTIVVALSAIYLLKVEVAGNIFYVIIVNMVLALVALAFGMLLSTLAKSEFQMMQFIPLIIMPQLFFSGIVPLKTMGVWAEHISKILPLSYSGDALSKIILEGKNLGNITNDILTLLIFFVILVALNILGLKRYRKV